MWIAAGVAAAIVARLIPYGRGSRVFTEAAAAVTAALAAGLAATALDFGGWREPDWRAGVFALLCALAALGILRLVRVLS